MRTKFKRIIIFCSDVIALANFYTEIFNLKITGKSDKEWTVLKAGTIEIAFHKSGSKFLKAENQKFKGANSNIKIVLEIDSDLVSFRSELMKKKVKMKTITRVKGLSYIWCDGLDPEGNVFQVIQSI